MISNHNRLWNILSLFPLLSTAASKLASAGFVADDIVVLAAVVDDDTDDDDDVVIVVTVTDFCFKWVLSALSNRIRFCWQVAWSCTNPIRAP